MRYLAIDLGDRRSGLAVGDAITRLVTAVGVVEVARDREGGEALLAELARAVDKHLGPLDTIVLGLPVNMDGTEGPRSKMVREFGARLAARTGRAVEFQDERLTTAAADWDMARSGMTHAEKKARRDALAAAAILRDFLEGLGGERPSE